MKRIRKMVMEYTSGPKELFMKAILKMIKDMMKV